jgi:hypothetical protein
MPPMAPHNDAVVGPSVDVAADDLSVFSLTMGHGAPSDDGRAQQLKSSSLTVVTHPYQLGLIN